MSDVTMAALATVPCWVAWQTESRPDGKPTKVPHAPRSGKKARADNPATWGTRTEATLRARLLPKPYGAGGVGLELSNIGNGLATAGIDLDTCRDPTTSAIDPWAQEVIARFASYTEISPSARGVKVFFTLDVAHLPTIRDAMATQHGKQWKRGTGDHPPAIELHVSNRYFAVTGENLPDTPPELRTVPTETLLWLIREAGPAFVGNGKDHRKERPNADGSRSAAAFRKGAGLRRQGRTFEEMCEALRNDPETANWCREKGDINSGRELQRIWDKAGGLDELRAPITPAAVIAEFNDRYMVVNEAGKVVIYEPQHDPILRRRYYGRITFEDFRRLYLNRRVTVGHDKDGNPITKRAADVWLTSEKRRQYTRGIIFDPSGKPSAPDVLNLWQGFNVTPKPGDWARLRNHVFTVICDGNREHFDYLMGWMARMVQRPAEQGEVAVVMRGGQGTGKGTLARALRHIFGPHGLAISNAKHLIGNFNAHLRDTVFLFADEAFFAGDRSHVGVINSIITEPYLAIEGKNQNVVQTPNFLHLMMASNEQWVVPASLDARRFLVLVVSEERKGDCDYFAAVWAEMEDGGGYQAMLYDLLRYDLTTFNVRRVPITEGLQEQKKLSLPTAEAWWMDVLHRGYVYKSKLGLEEHFGQWHEEIATELLFASYSEFADRKRERHPMSRETLGKFLVRMKARSKRLRDAAVGEHITDMPNAYGGTNRKAELIRQPRPQGYGLGTLVLARVGFIAATNFVVAWDDLPTDPATA